MSAQTAAEPAGDILAAAQAASMAALQAAERFAPPQHADAPQTGGPPAMLRDRFRIDPAQPLPDLDTPSAKASTVEDRRDPSRPLFALICNPGLPLRMVTLAVMRSANIKGVCRSSNTARWTGRRLAGGRWRSFTTVRAAANCGTWSRAARSASTRPTFSAA
ncbi:MAG: hypothetical protein O3A88_07245 [Proteobacteria bacterium]|nr:hypothetical protein [Pseudomonadota bacterium]